MNGLEEADIRCPYCGESITVLVDCTAGEQQYTEDCQVCCSPIVISVAAGPDGIDHIEASAENA